MVQSDQTAGFQASTHFPVSPNTFLAVVNIFNLQPIIKLLIVFLFLCICLEVQTVLFIVDLACSASMQGQPKNEQADSTGGGVNLRSGPQNVCFEDKVPRISNETTVYWYAGSHFIQDSLLSSWPEVALSTLS